MRRARARVSARAAGFTIVELLVVISVISILSLLFVSGFRSDSRGLALQRSTQLFLQAVDQARASSLSGTLHEGDTVAGGYGIFVQEGESEVVLFADCNQNGQYEENGAASTCPASASEKVRTMPLESEVSFTTVSPCTSGDCTLAVVFRPPFVSGVFYPTLVGSEAIFILENTIGETEEIHVNKLGVATIQ